jgi:hypothetical protein
MDIHLQKRNGIPAEKGTVTEKEIETMSGRGQGTASGSGTETGISRVTDVIGKEITQRALSAVHVHEIDTGPTGMTRGTIAGNVNTEDLGRGLGRHLAGKIEGLHPYGKVASN